MATPRVSYADFEMFAGGRPGQLSVLIVDQSDDVVFIGPDAEDLPPRYLDALRLWLWGSPTLLHLHPSGEPVEVKPEPTKIDESETEL